MCPYGYICENISDDIITCKDLNNSCEYVNCEYGYACYDQDKDGFPNCIPVDDYPFLCLDTICPDSFKCRMIKGHSTCLRFIHLGTTINPEKNHKNNNPSTNKPIHSNNPKNSINPTPTITIINKNPKYSIEPTPISPIKPKNSLNPEAPLNKFVPKTSTISSTTIHSSIISVTTSHTIIPIDHSTLKPITSQSNSYISPTHIYTKPPTITTSKPLHNPLNPTYKPNYNTPLYTHLPTNVPLSGNPETFPFISPTIHSTNKPLDSISSSITQINGIKPELSKSTVQSVNTFKPSPIVTSADSFSNNKNQNFSTIGSLKTTLSSNTPQPVSTINNYLTSSGYSPILQTAPNYNSAPVTFNPEIVNDLKSDINSAFSNIPISGLITSVETPIITTTNEIITKPLDTNNGYSSSQPNDNLNEGQTFINNMNSETLNYSNRNFGSVSIDEESSNGSDLNPHLIQTADDSFFNGSDNSTQLNTHILNEQIPPSSISGINFDPKQSSQSEIDGLLDKIEPKNFGSSSSKTFELLSSSNSYNSISNQQNKSSESSSNGDKSSDKNSSTDNIFKDFNISSTKGEIDSSEFKPSINFNQTLQVIDTKEKSKSNQNNPNESLSSSAKIQDNHSESKLGSNENGGYNYLKDNSISSSINSKKDDNSYNGDTFYSQSFGSKEITSIVTSDQTIKSYNSIQLNQYQPPLSNSRQYSPINKEESSHGNLKSSSFSYGNSQNDPQSYNTDVVDSKSDESNLKHSLTNHQSNSDDQNNNSLNSKNNDRPYTFSSDSSNEKQTISNNEASNAFSNRPISSVTSNSFSSFSSFASSTYKQEPVTRDPFDDIYFMSYSTSSKLVITRETILTNTIMVILLSFKII